MIEEIWRPIEGYEGLYEVSSYGRVRSLDRYDNRNCFRKGKVLSPIKDKDGYIQVSLYYNRKMYKKYVHRIVAEAFLPNPDNLPEVNHKDEDKTNNNVTNLEWCDRKYNLSYGSRQERYRNTMLENGYWTGLSKDEYIKKYYEKNKESIKKYKKKYDQDNKESIKKYKKKYNQKYYQDHKDKISDSKRSYYQENRDRICERQKEYYRKKKEQIQNNV